MSQLFQKYLWKYIEVYGNLCSWILFDFKCSSSVIYVAAALASRRLFVIIGIGIGVSVNDDKHMCLALFFKHQGF